MENNFFLKFPEKMEYYKNFQKKWKFYYVKTIYHQGKISHYFQASALLSFFEFGDIGDFFLL